MEIASFILGMCSVMVVSGLTVMVYALVKMKKETSDLKNGLETIKGDLQHAYDKMNINNNYHNLKHDEIWMGIDDRFEDLYRSLDSRLDKINTRLKMIQSHRVFTDSCDSSR